MKVDSVAIGLVKPYPGNPRRNRKSVGKVADSITEYGWRQPIVVDEDMVVIAGHTRLQAAKRLKITEVPVHVAKGLSAQQTKAYRLMDNRSAEDSSWDSELLTIELTGLLEDGFNMAFTGFSGEELNDLLSFLDQDEAEDEIPQDVEAVCKPGDLWILGDHRLKCGDATLATDVEHLLGEVKPHLMVTDPPYGVAYDAKWRSDAGINAKTGPAHGRVTNDQNADWTEAWALFPGDVAYVWHADRSAVTVAESLGVNGFAIRSQIIWVKSCLVIGRGHYHYQHEPCWYAVKNKGHWSGSRKQSTIWNIDKPLKSETGHSTQKPVECMRRPILNNSSPGHAVYDPFLGSGTTVIAAETEGRHCYALELEPTYCDIAIKRWEQFTDKQAVRTSS